MKKLFFSAICLLFTVGIFAQDPVVMTINGKDIKRSEFEYSYRKNNSEGVIDKKSIDEYVELFVNYKLKVEAALDASMDTLTSFKQEYAGYRNQVVFPTMITDADIDNEAKTIYDNTLQRIGPDGLFKCSHILLSIPSDATEQQKVAIKLRADSICNALNRGADFAELAKQYSQDPGSAQNGGALGPWLQRGQLVPEFETAALALQPGQMSRPVQSQFGWHIIRMDDRKQLEPFEELRSDILNFIEARNLRESIAKRTVSQRAQDTGKTIDEIVEEHIAATADADLEMKYLLNEYHDGLLLYEISNREVWDKASKDEAGQMAYFKKNKKNYTWDKPRFRGIAYHTKTAKDLAAVKKTVKGLKFELWGDKLKDVFNSDSTIRVRAEKGIFKEGDNALVDSIVFKSGKPAKHIANYPYHDVCGKVLKKPETYLDVKSQVISDYQDELEKQWIATLRKKFSVTINYDEIKKIKE